MNVAPQRVFMYGRLLCPKIRLGLGVKGENWEHAVFAKNWAVTDDWAGITLPIVRIRPTEHGVAVGAVAEFNDDELQRLDTFEGVGWLYDRITISTEKGLCWAYVGRIDNPYTQMEREENAENVRGTDGGRSEELEAVPGCEPAGR